MKKSVRGLGSPEKRSKPKGEVDAKTRALVLFRAGNCCERCGRSLLGILYSIHHRLPRGMGGSRLPWLHLPSNLLALCGSGTTGCHGWIESHREEAYDLGLLLRQGQEPTRIAVSLRSALGTWVFLTDEGEYVLIKERPMEPLSVGFLPLSPTGVRI